VTTAAEDLALQIRSELSDTAPQGFAFNDHVVRQDAALERVAKQLLAHPDAVEVDAALSRALSDEKDGWTLLKLVDLAERVGTPAPAAALMAVAAQPQPDERGRFLAGRACEVLLKLPLDLETRNRANAVCRQPLDDLVRFRLGAQRAQALHRPRRVEWTLLAVLMAIALAGLVLALRAL
jgi:hypothetical protein